LHFCFVDLHRLFRSSRINIGGINNLQQGAHVVDNSCQHVKNPTNAERITEIEIKVGGFTAVGYTSKLAYHLSPVEVFVESAVEVSIDGVKTDCSAASC